MRRCPVNGSTTRSLNLNPIRTGRLPMQARLWNDYWESVPNEPICVRSSEHPSTKRCSRCCTCWMTLEWTTETCSCCRNRSYQPIRLGEKADHQPNSISAPAPIPPAASSPGHRRASRRRASSLNPPRPSRWSGRATRATRGVTALSRSPATPPSPSAHPAAAPSRCR